MSNNDINSPKHYKKKEDSIECIEAIEESMTPEKFQGHLKGTVMKYIWRYEDKAEPLKDLKKAQVYLDWLIRKLEGKPLFDKPSKSGAPIFIYGGGQLAAVGDLLIHQNSDLTFSYYVVESISNDYLHCRRTVVNGVRPSLFTMHYTSKYLYLMARKDNYSL